MSTSLRSLSDAIAGGLRWWKRELAGLLSALPGGSRQRRADILLLEIGRSGVRALRCANGHREELARVALSGEAGAALSGVGDLRALDGAIDPKVTPVVARVSPDEVLRRVLTLPPAAAEDLRAVLSFEMHRQTPFTADEVYFDYRELPRTPGDPRLRVEMSVIRRTLVDEVMALLPPWDLRVAEAVDVPGVDAEGLALRLAPPSPTVTPGTRVMTKLLWAANAALLVAVLAIPLVRQAGEIERLRERVAAAKAEAEIAAALRAQAERLQADRRFLIEAKRDRPALVSVLSELTASIPDSTWVQRLEVKSGKVRISGTSTTASALISVIEDAPLFRRVAFNAPVTRNPATGKEQFQLVFEVAPPAEAQEDEDVQDLQQGTGSIAAVAGLARRR